MSIPGTPAPAPDVPEILTRIDAIGDVIRDAAPQQEHDRRISDEVMTALRGTGVSGALKPSRIGGCADSVVGLLQVTRQVGLYDSSTAWVVTLATISNYIATLMGAEAQDEIWGTKQLETMLSGVIAPGEPAVKVAGGYRVSGRWYYNSASWWTDWAWLGVPLLDEAGEFDQPAIVAIPRGEYQIEDTWYTVGMRATASNLVVVDDVFVPDHRVTRLADIVTGNAPGLRVEGRDALAAATLQPVFALGLIGPLLGAGTARSSSTCGR